MVSEKALKKFKQIYFMKYGIELTDEQATEQAVNLLSLMKILTRPKKKKKVIEQLGEIL